MEKVAFLGTGASAGRTALRLEGAEQVTCTRDSDEAVVPGNLTSAVAVGDAFAIVDEVDTFSSRRRLGGLRNLLAGDETTLILEDT